MLKNTSSLGILLKYESNKINENLNTIQISKKVNLSSIKSKGETIAVIGAGNYASRILIPSFAKADANFYSICDRSGVFSTILGEKYSFYKSTTDVETILSDPHCNSVLILTRHDSHADLIIKALKSGKNVFVEKPLCINNKELNLIKEAYSGENILMVGFNRRFSPFIKTIKNQISLSDRPKVFSYTCNAGFIPSNHWTQDPKIGGGRLIGEACHFVDLLRYLSGSRINELNISYLENNISAPKDTFILSMKFRDGSLGNIIYSANGCKSYPKERLEVFLMGRLFDWIISRN